MDVKLRDVILQVSRLKYLESILQNDVEFNEDVTHKIQARRLKWRKKSGVV